MSDLSTPDLPDSEPQIIREPWKQRGRPVPSKQDDTLYSFPTSDFLKASISTGGIALGPDSMQNGVHERTIIKRRDRVPSLESGNITRHNYPITRSFHAKLTNPSENSTGTKRPVLERKTRIRNEIRSLEMIPVQPPEVVKKPLTPESLKSPATLEIERSSVTPESMTLPVNPENEKLLVNPENTKLPVNPEIAKLPVNPEITKLIPDNMKLSTSPESHVERTRNAHNNRRASDPAKRFGSTEGIDIPITSTDNLPAMSVPSRHSIHPDPMDTLAPRPRTRILRRIWSEAATTEFPQFLARAFPPTSHWFATSTNPPNSLREGTNRMDSTAEVPVPSEEVVIPVVSKSKRLSSLRSQSPPGVYQSSHPTTGSVRQARYHHTSHSEPPSWSERAERWKNRKTVDKIWNNPIGTEFNENSVSGQPPPAPFTCPERKNKYVQKMVGGKLMEKLRVELKGAECLVSKMGNLPHILFAGTTEGLVTNIVKMIVVEERKDDPIPGLSQTSENKVVFETIEVILFTHQKFTTSSYLLALLRGLWEKATISKTTITQLKLSFRRARIFYFLQKWLEEHALDFDPHLQSLLFDWLNSMEMTKFKLTLLSKAKQRFHKKTRMENYIYYSSDEDKGKERLVFGKFGIEDLEPEMVAEQWCFMDMENFKKLRRKDVWELCSHSPWNQMLKRGEKFAQYVASEIVQKKDLKDRVAVVTKFIKIALTFLENDNYNGVMWFWEGFQKPAVTRLKHTKENLPEQAREIIDYFHSKFSGDLNYQLLKNAMQNGLGEQRPVLPWLKLVHSNICELESTQSDFVLPPNEKGVTSEVPLINMEKMYTLTEHLKFFDSYQRAAQHFELNNKCMNKIVLREYFEHLPVLSEEQLMFHSQWCESDT